MKKLLCLLTAAVIVFSALIPAAAANSGQRVVRVAYFESETNMEKIEGNYVGYTISYLDDIAEFTGWKYEFVELTVPQAWAALEKGEIDIIPMASYSRERAEKYAYPDYEYGTAGLTMFVAESSPITGKNYAEQNKKLVVAATKGSPSCDEFNRFAMQTGIDYEFLLLETFAEIRSAVVEGKADAGVLSNYQQFSGTKPVARFAASPYYMVTNKKNEEVLNGLNVALHSIKILDPDHDSELFNKFDKNTDGIVAFSSEEIEYLKKKSKIRIAYSPTWIPLEENDSLTGEAGGILVDILKNAADNASLAVEFVPSGAPVDALKNGDADMMGGFVGGNQQATKQGLILSEPYLEATFLLIRNSAGTKDSTHYASTFLPEKGQFPGTEKLEQIEYASPEACLEALKSGEVCKAYINTYCANYLLATGQFGYLKRTTLQNVEVPLSVAFLAGTDSRLVSIINKALASVSMPEINDIIVKNTLELSSGGEVSLADYIRSRPMAAMGIITVIFVLVIISILYIADLKRRKLEREANKKLQAALEVAEKASKAKGNFMSRMSHEIRTPLNAVIGYNSIARGAMSGNADEAQRKRAEMKVMDCLIKSDIATKHLLTIINDVLDMSAIESGNIKVAKEAFDFKSLISAITVLFYSQARAKSVDFKVTLDKLSEEWIVGDQMRVNQILTNLLSNAVKFTPSGGKVLLKVQQIGLDDGAIRILFMVSDTGIGMDKEYISQIWNPFEQEDSTISRRFGGTGLGLTITKNLVDLLDGTIEVTSEKNIGSTFRVELEFGRTPQPDGARVYSFSDMNALVVDDDPSTCEYMRLLFDRCGAACRCVNSGEEALEEIARAQEAGERFTLFLVDWHMPGMDGIETIKQIRMIMGNEAPVIVVTAYDYSEIEPEARLLGITKFVAKPVFQSALFDMLANVSGREVKRSSRAAEKFKFSGERVLLAEDNEMNMEIAKEILTNAGLSVDSVWNGSEAVAIFDSAPEGTYKVILMDIQMPDMDGLEATRRIRALNKAQAGSVPIIAMTADAFAENVAQSLEAGMNDHVSKPIDVDHLIKTLQKYIN